MNCFSNDFLLVIKNVELGNVLDDNTIYAEQKSFLNLFEL